MSSDGSGEVWTALVQHREACEMAVEEEFVRLATMIIHEPLDGLTRKDIVRQLEQARASAVSEQLLEYALRCMRQELDAAEPDWAIVDEALRICFHAGALPEDAVEILRKLLVYPRDGDMPEDHSEALLLALTVTGRVGTQAAVDLLLEATTAAFWQESGPVSRPARLGESRSSDRLTPLARLRSDALFAIANAPAPLSQEVLEELRDHYLHYGGPPSEFEHQARDIALRALYYANIWNPPDAPKEDEDR